jgi:hypothetical protein
MSRCWSDQDGLVAAPTDMTRSQRRVHTARAGVSNRLVYLTYGRIKPRSTASPTIDATTVSCAQATSMGAVPGRKSTRRGTYRTCRAAGIDPVRACGQGRCSARRYHGARPVRQSVEEPTATACIGPVCHPRSFATKAAENGCLAPVVVPSRITPDGWDTARPPPCLGQPHLCLGWIGHPVRICYPRDVNATVPPRKTGSLPASGSQSAT